MVDLLDDDGISVSEKMIAYGYAVPISVGEQLDQDIRADSSADDCHGKLVVC